MSSELVEHCFVTTVLVWVVHSFRHHWTIIQRLISTIYYHHPRAAQVGQLLCTEISYHWKIAIQAIFVVG